MVGELPSNDIPLHLSSYSLGGFGYAVMYRLER